MSKTTAFPENIRMLRENKKISQKSAASSLGISQALLSHYEKGIRECGLNFLVRAADFYNVTADFLLGRTENGIPDDSSGGTVTLSENNKNPPFRQCRDCELKWNGAEMNARSVLYKNMLTKSFEHLFDFLRAAENDDLAKYCGEFLNLAAYLALLSLEKNTPPQKFAEIYGVILDLNRLILQSPEIDLQPLEAQIYIKNMSANAEKILDRQCGGPRQP